MEKKYIVGVDFGHGETAAWIVPIGADVNVEADGQPLMIRKSKKNESERKIDSVVYIGDDGSFGANEGECPNSIMVNEFKGRIRNLDDLHKNAYKSFIQMVYKRIFEQNDILKQDGLESNFYFQIACPTNWDETDKIDYINFFNEALSMYGVHIDYLMNESDAAYFCFNKTVSPSKDDFVLVVDYGSSTIDYTVVQGSKKVSDDNWSSPTLGASEIEKTILALYMSKNENAFATTRSNIENILSSDYPLIANSLISRIEYAIRKQKEHYYTEQHSKFLLKYNLYETTGIEELIPYDFTIKCDIEEAIEDYKKHVFNDLEQLHNKILDKTNGAPVKKIILSGGASIMPWVSDYIRTIFGDDVELVADGDPGYVVAKGVARYAQKLQVAIKQLLTKVEGYSFMDIYKTSDKIAYRDAVIEEIKRCADKLNCRSSLTGVEIRKEFCKCLSSLNAGHYSFANKVQNYLDSNLTSKIRDAIKETMQNVFNYKVDTDDVKIHVDAQILEFRQNEFEVGGSFYNSISAAIDGAANKWDFTWDKSRAGSEKTKIIDGTKNRLIDFFNGDYVTYIDENFKDFVNIIKGAAISEAMRIFKTKDVFKSTFIA